MQPIVCKLELNRIFFLVLGFYGLVLFFKKVVCKRQPCSSNTGPHSDTCRARWRKGGQAVRVPERDSQPVPV